MGATTTVAIHVSRANRAGSCGADAAVRRLSSTHCIRSGNKCPSARNGDAKGVRMPRGRSTFTKRQKEQTRQQKQRDKAERRNQRRQEEAVAGSVDEMDELRKHAAEQAALFDLGAEGADIAE